MIVVFVDREGYYLNRCHLESVPRVSDDVDLHDRVGIYKVRDVRWDLVIQHEVYVTLIPRGY